MIVVDRILVVEEVTVLAVGRVVMLVDEAVFKVGVSLVVLGLVTVVVLVLNPVL